MPTGNKDTLAYNRASEPGSRWLHRCEGDIGAWTKRPVVVYGANGFSGRLIAEYLREYNTPFIAAGRCASRIKDVMGHVPGIETADYEVVETGGTSA